MSNSRKGAKSFRTAAFVLIVLIASSPAALAASSSNPITYDANGNRQSAFGLYFEYNGFNQLVKVRNGTANGTIIEAYIYDHEGNRVAKVAGNETTIYVNDNFVRTVNQSGTFDTVYYYDERNLIGRLDPDGKRYFYHPDHLGSTSLITNETGGIVEETTYEPYGQVLSGGNDRYDYTGKETDLGTGLAYYGARYYDPAYAQFTQADSNIPDVYNPQALNRYSYTLNNPYKYTDPDGNIPVPLITAGIGALIGFASSAIIQYAATGQVNWGDAGKAAVVGAVAGLTGFGVGAAVVHALGGGAVASVVAGAASGAAAGEVGEFASDAISGQEYSFDPTRAATNAVIGGIAGGIAHRVSSTLSSRQSSQVLSYRDAQKITQGGGGDLQAHHLVEQRFLRQWGHSVNDAPSVVLTKQQHRAYTDALRRQLPFGASYSKQGVFEAYQKVYSKNSDYMKAIQKYFKK
jgi:RHS repeat-associated protein